jgi:hypothetical protein
VVGKRDSIDDAMAAAPRPSPICSVAATVLGSDRWLPCWGEEARGQAAGAGPRVVEQRAAVARRWHLGRWEKEKRRGWLCRSKAARKSSADRHSDGAMDPGRRAAIARDRRGTARSRAGAMEAMRTSGRVSSRRTPQT